MNLPALPQKRLFTPIDARQRIMICMQWEAPKNAGLTFPYSTTKCLALKVGELQYGFMIEFN